MNFDKPESGDAEDIALFPTQEEHSALRSILMTRLVNRAINQEPMPTRQSAVCAAYLLANDRATPVEGISFPITQVGILGKMLRDTYSPDANQQMIADMVATQIEAEIAAQDIDLSIPDTVPDGLV